MKKPKLTEEQIAFALKLAESGTSVEEICRKTGISQATFYVWRKKFGGLGGGRTASIAAARRREPQAQTAGGRPEPGVMLQDVLSKKALRPTQRKTLVGHLLDRYRISARRACDLLRQSRSAWYQPRENDDAPLLRRIEEIAATRSIMASGGSSCYCAGRAGRPTTSAYRLYCQAGLNLQRKRPRRRKAAAHCLECPALTAPNQVWSMDFMADALFDGRRFRALTIVDNFTKESWPSKSTINSRARTWWR